MTTEKRNRERMAMTVFCRIAPAGNRRKASWKRIENISGAGMLIAWSKGEPDIAPPNVGDSYIVELQLPEHPVFGQRALQFKTRVVRVSRQPNGRILAGLQSTQGRFKFIKPPAWPESADSFVVN